MYRFGSSPSERDSDASNLIHGIVDDLAVRWAHRLQRLLLARCDDLFGDLRAEPLQRGRTLLPVAGDIDEDTVRPGRALALNNRTGQILQGAQGLPRGPTKSPRSSPRAAISTVSSSSRRVSTEAETP